jgi:hypothetical protein
MSRDCGPQSYRKAAWRNTALVDLSSDRIGLGFTLEDGGVIRLSIPTQDALGMIDSIQYLARTRSEKLSNPLIS